MLNKKLFTVGCAAGSMALFSLIACSSDADSNKLTGATIDPDAIALNSSSSSNPGSSAANFDFPEIAFKTAATSVVALDGGELKTFEAENGASAECTGDEKSYISKIQIDADGVVKNSLELKNFGSGCDSVLAEFIMLCHSKAVVYNGKDDKKTCDENGNVKSYCYDDRAVTTIPADSTVNFNDIVRNLSTFSEELCNDVYKDATTKTGIFSTLSSTSRDFSSSSVYVETSPDPVDSEFECDLKTGKNCDKDDFKIDTSYVPVVNPRQELPSSPAVGIDTSANRSFIIKPNVETLNVSDAERSVLDSLARAYPQKTETDAIDGMTIFLSYAAEYRFTTEMDEYYVRGDGSERSEIDVYREEKGVKSSMVLPLDVYYGGQGYISVTTLQVSESSILYLVRATLGSYASLLIDPFRTECEATSGSFYEYGPMADVAVACAVKNFSGITFDGILSQQKNLFRNAYATFVQPVED